MIVVTYSFQVFGVLAEFLYLSLEVMYIYLTQELCFSISKREGYYRDEMQSLF